MSNKYILLFGVLSLVLIAEHILLTYIYKKPSSLRRLLYSPSQSAKSDGVMWSFYYFLMKYVRTAASFVVIPGLLWHALKWLKVHFEWEGILGGFMPENQIVATLTWLIIIDFGGYISHRLLHQTPFLWSFHKLHHSVTEFNIITGIRVSLSEKFFGKFINLLFITIVIGLTSPGAAFSILVIRRIIDLLQHSDLPWDYHVLGYIIASPRFHRMHHSNDPTDFDVHYGNIFSFWDYLFRTISPNYKLSTTSADNCTLGLSTVEETQKYNDWRFALTRDTLIWMPISIIKRITQKLIEPAIEKGAVTDCNSPEK